MATLKRTDLAVLTIVGGKTHTFRVRTKINDKPVRTNLGPLRARLRKEFPKAKVGRRVKFDFYTELAFTTRFEAVGAPAVRVHPFAKKLWAVLRDSGWELSLPRESSLRRGTPRIARR